MSVLSRDVDASFTLRRNANEGIVCPSLVPSSIPMNPVASQSGRSTPIVPSTPPTSSLTITGPSIATRPASIALPASRNLQPHYAGTPQASRSHGDIRTIANRHQDNWSVSSYHLSVHGPSTPRSGRPSSRSAPSSRRSSRAPHRHFTRDPSLDNSNPPSRSESPTPPVPRLADGVRAAHMAGISIVTSREASTHSRGSSVSFEFISPTPPTSSTLDNLFNVREIPELPAGRNIQLYTTANLGRYEAKRVIDDFYVHHEIAPLTTHFPHSATYTDPGNWTPTTHPEGALYFYHEQKRIFTDAYMYDYDIRQEIELFAKYLDDYLQAAELSLPSDECDLVLEIVPAEDGEGTAWCYYYVDHRSRTLFWLTPFDTDYLLAEVRGVTSPAHIKLEIETQYWMHWSYFPETHGRQDLDDTLHEELSGIILHGIVDTMNSMTSTMPHSVTELSSMLTLIKKVQAGKEMNKYMICAFCRIMSNFCHWRFVHFHGQHGARLDRDQTVYSDPARRKTWLITLLSLVLFFAPEIHLRELGKLWVDGIIVESVWKLFISKLLNDWQEFTLFSTVLLNANVAFLTIPGVSADANGNLYPSQSPAQIASYISIIASVGSIVVGLLLVRQNRSRNRDDPGEAAAFLHRKYSPRYRLELLAVIYSLPYALLMWAMGTFLVALLALCFDMTRLVTRLLVGVASVVIAASILWCVVYGWDTADSWETNIRKSLHAWTERTKEKLKDVSPAKLRHSVAAPVDVSDTNV